VLNFVIVAQAGRIGYQAVLCAASIRAFHQADAVRIFIAIPKNSRRWESDPSVADTAALEAFRRYDCEIVSIDNADFGSAYPHANKFYAIGALPPDEPFLFLDSDSVLAAPMREGDLDFGRPSLKPAAPNFPVAAGDGRTVGEVWRSLYAFFGVDAEPYRDRARADGEHQCYPYYNGGIVYYANAGSFARLWLEMAKRIWSERPAALAGQPLKPWLDQIVLPLVLARLGVPRAGEPDRIHKTVVHYHFPFYLQVRHAQAIALFDELSKDDRLMAVLRNDEGFRYYLSDEAKAIVREVHEEFWNSGKRGGYKAFQEALRHRVRMMR
jgi:hypothetical protein